MGSANANLYGSDLSLLGPLAAKLAQRDKLKWIIALTASLGAILEIIDINIVNVALPDIQGNVGATLSEVGWVSTAYSCANVIIIPLTAWLGIRFGKKRYFIFSLVGFTLASILCGLSSNLAMLIMARVFQGLCGGGLLVKAQSMLYETFPREEQGAAQALFGIGIISGPALGPVLGGYLTDALGWRWIFFINLPVGILAVLMALTFLPEDKEEDMKPSARVDWLGIGLLAVGLGCLQTMLEEGQQYDWFGSQFITTMAVGSVVALGCFIWWEMNIDLPAVDLRVLRYRSVAAGSTYSMVLGMGLFGIMFAIPIFVQNYLHFSAFQSGLLLLPGALASAGTMMILGRVVSRFDARFLVATGALVTVGVGLVLMRLNPDSGTSSLFWPMIVRGIGTVLMFLPLSLATLGGVPKKDVPSAAGFYNLTRQLGSSVGVAVLTTLLVRQQTVHRAVLVEKITLFRPESLSRLAAMTAGFGRHSGDAVAGHSQALRALDSIVNAQAGVLAFDDIFRYVALLFTVSLPLILLLGKGPTKQPLPADVH